MGSIVAEAQALADQIKAATDVFATVDPAVADANRPCVLIAPPSMDYSARTNVWSVVLLSSYAIGSFDALAELDGLLQAVVPVLDVETATPTAYLLVPERAAPVPAYTVRVTT